MESVELRDSEDARRYILQGLWLQRVARPSVATVRPALAWALEIAASGHALPPIGFVADLGHLVFGLDRQLQFGKEPLEVPGWPHTLARSYEDHVLGKAFADWSFERGTDALRRYAGRDQAKGLGYVVRQIRERAQLGGVELSPAILRAMRDVPPETLLAQGYESLSQAGPMPVLVAQYDALIRSFRRLSELLAPEDIIALEQRTALADLGQYVAHRQILQQAARLESRLPARPIRPLAGRREVPTRVLDEDQYPVGGYSSISTRGSIESLLHSQLAYMESESPDLFDFKFVRDELFYYSRDENQFLRRRRAFTFVLGPDLVNARFKDSELPVQRIILILATVLTLVRRLTEWLSHDALRFDILFVQPTGTNGLLHEKELLEILLREPIERGVAHIAIVDSLAAAEAMCAGQARVSQLHAMVISAAPIAFQPAGTVVTQLVVPGPRPVLTDGNGVEIKFAEEDAADSWQEAGIRVLGLWV